MDPGIDDAWALVVASGVATVQGVSTVAGNVPLSNTFGNAQRILEVLDRAKIPIYPGASNPLLGPLITAKAFHGEFGLGQWRGREVDIPPDQLRVWTHWAALCADLKTTHLIATGPLTNLATALLAHPQLANAWASVTVMCGALPGSQIDKAQEFNVYVDPHAADIVFHWTQHLQLIGINVAHKAVIPLSDLKRLESYSRVGTMLSQMLGYYSQRSRGEGGNPTAFPIDDVVAVAAVLQPDLFSWEELPLAVVREGPLRGTVVLSPVDLKRPPIKVAVNVNASAFRDWLWQSMDAAYGVPGTPTPNEIQS
ncbi:MAG: nucleoside hydrolase [Sulfobacillus acidophilus]|uniref:Nucleoside hydrolase n=1 Tax=Sulfobacillus acidophilus TaxID=53633 RepID=A0A2T2WDD8_9FIRM|nr:MAG: nucleoside hydrolase [Sulfobacillus acidophilus]